MQQVEARHRYDAAPEAVRAIYTDHARWGEWSGMPPVRLERPGVSEPNGTGAIRAFRGGLREEILDFEAPRRMTCKIVGGPVPIRNLRGEVVFEPDDHGTRVVWCCSFDAVIPGTGGLIRRFVERSFRGALAGLERAHFPAAASE